MLVSLPLLLFGGTVCFAVGLCCQAPARACWALAAALLRVCECAQGLRFLHVCSCVSVR
jgi:hypothetical protein